MDGYHSDENVRTRLIEYAGGFGASGVTCAYFSQCDAGLDWFLEEGKEVARSSL